MTVSTVNLPGSIDTGNFLMLFSTDHFSICDKLIDLWKTSGEKNPGWVGAGYRPEIKDSTDVCIPYDSLSGSILQEYCDNILQPCVDLYIDRFPECNTGEPWSVIEQVNIQHYSPGGGFKGWHSERTVSRPPFSKRHLVFMTYLNDVYSGADYNGGTEWLHQKIKIKAQKGYTAIWPVDWTYTHRSIVSPDQDKYIITGWFSYYFNDKGNGK